MKVMVLGRSTTEGNEAAGGGVLLKPRDGGQQWIGLTTIARGKPWS